MTALTLLCQPVSWAEIENCDAGQVEAQVQQGEVELAAGRLSAARTIIMGAIEAGESCGTSTELRLAALGELTVIERIARNPEKGLEWANQAISLAEQPFPNHDLYLAEALENRAQMLSDMGRFYDAEEPVRSAIAIWERQPVIKHSELASCYNTLGVLHLRLQDPDGAKRQLSRALTHASLTTDEAPLAAVYHNIAIASWHQGDAAQGLGEVDQALEIAERRIGMEHPYLVEILKTKAGILTALHRKADARKVNARVKVLAAKIQGR